MDHLIRDSAPLELFAWLEPGAELPGRHILAANPSSEGLPDEQFTTVQNYFAEYHLEYYRQRQFNEFPSRLHALLLFATRIDAENFRAKQPERFLGKTLARVRSQGAYVVSFHDSSWLDYLRLPHNLSLEALDKISSHYWNGVLSEDVEIDFLNERWWEPPVIEALFLGTLEPIHSA